MEKIFGIDLGTTNSSIAVLESGKPRVIPIDGSPIVPSVVSRDPETGEIIVGRRARNRAILYPEHTRKSIKRLMGQSVRVALGEASYSPEEVSSLILGYLRQKAQEATGLDIRKAVITVPAYFEDSQRRATIRAGELAGLDVVRIINEPTSASLVYDRMAARGAGEGVLNGSSRLRRGAFPAVGDDPSGADGQREDQ